MITILLTMFLALCWIRGFNFIFLPGEIFGEIGDKMRLRLIDWIAKPLFDCPFCMPSIHGTIFYALFCWQSNPVYMWPIFCIALCGLVVLTDKK